MDIAKWVRLFPFSVGSRRCPECAEDGETVYMETDYVRAPAVQDHWRGVEAWSCPECDHAEHKPDDAHL